MGGGYGPWAVARTTRAQGTGHRPLSENVCPRPQSASAVVTRRERRQCHLAEGRRGHQAP